MKLRNLFKGAVLVTASVFLVFVVMVLGCFAFGCYIVSDGQGWSAPVEKISASLTRDGAGYSFTGQSLLEEDCWAMLLDEQGHEVWSFRKPEDVPSDYSAADVASFTRWYLNDYPVRCWVREDGLLMVGSPQGSVWKHDIAMDIRDLRMLPAWFLVFFLLALGSVLLLAWLTVRRWFRQDQRMRDAARSDWINGVSHDIRTPLSVVMGYSAQLENAPDLAPEYKSRARAIRAQSQVIRDLVNDLNLTMRLDCAMQPLRRESFQPAAFLRQAAADFLNGGMGEGFEFEIDLPDSPLPELFADPFLLRRAVNNLLTNCVRHNAPGCPIRLGVQAQGRWLLLWVEGGTTKAAQPRPAQALGADGGAAHGTGLRLVAQIAAAHGGRAQFHSGPPFRSELRLPVQK